MDNSKTLKTLKNLQTSKFGKSSKSPKLRKEMELEGYDSLLNKNLTYKNKEVNGITVALPFEKENPKYKNMGGYQICPKCQKRSILDEAGHNGGQRGGSRAAGRRSVNILVNDQKGDD
jgi:hypothetical protein